MEWRNDIVDDDAFIAVRDAARRAYAAAAELVLPKIQSGLVAAAGQSISDDDWLELTAEVSDAYGDVYLDAVISSGAEMGILPSDADIEALMFEHEAAVNEFASSMRGMLDLFSEDMLRQGVPLDEVRERLLDAGQSPLNPRKADMFARTAVTTAVNSGFEATYRAAGITAKSWITQRDDRVREAHRDVDRDVVPAELPFRLDGYDARFPGDPNLPIRLRINCRCVLGWVDGSQVKRAVSAKKSDLYLMARQLDIRGRSRMNKPELQLAVVKELCLQGLAAGTDCPERLDDMNKATLLLHGRLANIRGRYRMNKPELLDRVKEAFTTLLPFSAATATLANQPFDWVDGVVSDVVNGEAVSVPEADAADVVAEFAAEIEPVDLTRIRVTPTLFSKVASNPLTRDQMPQIPEQHLDDFQRHLTAGGVRLVRGRVSPLALFATQSELDGRKVGKMIHAIRQGRFEPEHPTFVSTDGLILDGHHRWAALALLALAGEVDDMPVIEVGLPTADLLDAAREFADDRSIASKRHGMAFDPSQPRDERGRWASVGGSTRSTDWQSERARLIESDHPVVRDVTDAEIEQFEKLYGQGIEAVFPPGSFEVSTMPIPRASRRKREPLYDRDAVAAALNRPVQLSKFDPRTLRSSQSGVTRSGVAYYLWENREAHLSGVTYADQDQPGNRFPVIFEQPRTKQLTILSGHHRAVAALVDGRPLVGIFVRAENDD